MGPDRPPPRVPKQDTANDGLVVEAIAASVSQAPVSAWVACGEIDSVGGSSSSSPFSAYPPAFRQSRPRFWGQWLNISEQDDILWVCLHFYTVRVSGPLPFSFLEYFGTAFVPSPGLNP